MFKSAFNERGGGEFCIQSLCLLILIKGSKYKVHQFGSAQFWDKSGGASYGDF